MKTELAIIGDNFILPEVFEKAIIEACGNKVDCRLDKNNWPDEPVEHGYAVDGSEGLKEYIGNFQEVVDFTGDAEILVIHQSPVSSSMLEKLPKLKLIACSRGGPVNVDIAAAKEKGISVINTPGRNETAVAEFTIGGILSESRKIREGHESLRKGIWRGDLYRADVTGRELSEMTIGVVGYGNIGTRVVKLLRAFGSRILVCDPYVQLTREDHEAGVTQVELQSLLSQSDIVTLHPRVSDETRQMINADTLKMMKPGALLVNTARGPLCDYDALYDALSQGRLGGAMLETFSIEPPPKDWALLSLNNVTLTPHIAGASIKTTTHAAKTLAADIRRFIDGEPMKNLC